MSLSQIQALKIVDLSASNLSTVHDEVLNLAISALVPSVHATLFPTSIAEPETWVEQYNVYTTNLWAICAVERYIKANNLYDSNDDGNGGDHYMDQLSQICGGWKAAKTATPRKRAEAAIYVLCRHHHGDQSSTSETKQPVTFIVI